MFLIELTYTAPLERVDPLLPEHMAWLDGNYAAGHFLASGPKVPRDGGMILATTGDRAALDALLDTEPLTKNGVAAARVTEFRTTRTTEALAAHRVPVG